jgi:hypothetical protein
MASSQATSVEEYLRELSPERLREFKTVLDLVRENLPAGYVEGMGYGMMGWSVPLSVYPDTYNKQPLAFAGLANQKHYISLYLMPVYGDPRYKKILDEGGKKLNMGKSCIRFTRAEQLPLEAIVRIIRECTMEKYVAFVKAAGSTRKAHEGA